MTQFVSDCKDATVLVLLLELTVDLASGQEASRHGLETNDVGEWNQCQVELWSAVIK